MLGETGPEVSPEELDSAEQYRRRRATAVLCPVFGDIKDSTRLLEELGEVEYEELRQSHDRAVRHIIERDREGALLKTYGDGFLAVFAEPSTAVERCLEIQQDLKAQGHRFQLRIGIDMGQVALKRASGIGADIFGRHVNRASRIEAQASPGSVLTSFPVYDSSVGWLRKTVAWQHRSPTQLKGFAEPISLHEPILVPQEAEALDSASHVMGAGLGEDFIRDPYHEALRRIADSPLAAFARRVRRPLPILWVDDRPEGNRVLAQALTRAGLEVVTALDTEEALAVIRAPAPIRRRMRFTAVISDMGRGQAPTAGLDLLTKIRESAIAVPFLIFTSPASEAEYAAEAIERGATVCTSGTVSLLQALGRVIDASPRAGQ